MRVGVRSGRGGEVGVWGGIRCRVRVPLVV